MSKREPAPRVKQRVTKTTDFTYELDYKTLADILREHFKIPDYVALNIDVDVPTGGDYSGMRLDIGRDVPLRLNWQESEETQS